MTDPVCRICGQSQETIDHIVAGCPEVAKTEYLERHNKAASYLHWNICKEFNINTKAKCHEHGRQTVLKKHDITILRDMPKQTDRTKKKKILIDMDIPTDKNSSVGITEKLSKYKDLETEIERIWGMKATTIPVLVGP